jgi:hypothetical protein
VKEKIYSAFMASCNGYSIDRVIADPELNRRFLEQCRNLGLDESVRDLNKRLLNTRKAGELKGIAKRKRTSFPDLDDYRFASEVAVRFIERKHSVSLDDVICDPNLAAEFDAVAKELAPGFDSLRYRWAALNLRKTRNLRPELLSRIVTFETVRLDRLEAIDLATLPAEQGIYIFYSTETTLYVGEAMNLRKRVGKHVDHSDNKGLARWLWTNGSSDIRLELRILPQATPTRVRRAVEAELINSRRPLFNVQMMQ